MPSVKRFEDLEVWKAARELVREVYALTAKFPKSETYGLASNIRGHKFHEASAVYPVGVPVP